MPANLYRANTGSKRLGLYRRRHPSQARAQRTFDTVLEAAIRLIEQEGVERATTRRIALAAGVSIGAVYEYFPNKESIVLHIGTSWLRRVRQMVDDLHPSRSGIPDLMSYLNRMMSDAERMYRDQPGLLAVVRLSGAIPELREADQAHDLEVTGSITSALQHFAPHAEREELKAIANFLLIISHSVLSDCFVAQTGDTSRLLRMLRVSLYTLVTPLLLPAAP
jgi:AcrR family transcriptional regulator